MRYIGKKHTERFEISIFGGVDHGFKPLFATVLEKN